MNATLDRRKENIEAVATVSPLQQGMLFHSLRSREHDPYFYQIVFSLTGALDVALLERAWQLAVDRHQVLRAEYRWEETATPLQVIFKSRRVELARLDLRGQAPAEQLERLRELLGEERRQGYDFRHASGVRLRLIRIAEDVHWLSWSYHHVTLDGWSMALVLGDAFGFYQRQGRSGDAPSPLPFTVYLDWLHAQDQGQALGYWRELLAGFDAPTPLPRSAAGGALAYAERLLRLEPSESELLQRSARGLGVTLNTLVQGAWALLLGRHAGTSEVVFGSTVSGRALELPGIEASAGLFINTLPVRASLRGQRPLRDWLAELQRQNVDSRRYEHTPLVEIRRAAGLSGDEGLFDSVVVFDNYPVDEVLERQPTSLRVEPVRLFAEDLAASAGRNNYALTLNVVLGARIQLTLAYRSEQFTAERIEQLIDQLRAVLLGIACEPDAPLGNLGLGPAAHPERPEPAVPTPPLLLEKLREHARTKGSATAVQSESGRHDFAELDRLSDRVAGWLAARGVSSDDRVGLCAERSGDFVVLLLGILKAGAAYLPLDPKLPAARLAELASDAAVRLLLATERALGVAQAATEHAAVPVASLATLLSEAAPPAPVRAIHPEQAAYVIFTSGSSGRPKGVVVSHGALARYVQGLLARLELAPGASFAMVSTVAADLGHTALFGALYSGAPLHLIAEERAFDPDAFAEYLARQQIGVLKIVPSHLRALLNASEPARALPAHALIVGGEASDWALVDQVQALAPRCRIINHYGPTETTVGVSSFELHGARPDAQNLPIGRALPGAELRVLDRHLNPLPPGAAGELYIGGARLARGYWRSPALTAERFVPDPWSPDGGRLYRSGDRVRRGPAGDLEFLGRIDRQVKLRGYRIELGEIEARLCQHPAVREASVLVRATSGGAQQLVAYVVPRDGSTEPARLPETLLGHLAGALPDYMLPSRILTLGEMPLTPNGKLDRAALPWDDVRPGAPSSDADASPTERQLIEVWKEVLRVAQVGLEDNFFRLGGDSISSLQVIARARRRGLRVTPKQLFEQPTLRALARVAIPLEPAAEKRAAAAQAAPPRERRLPLLPLQTRFFEQRLALPARYTQSIRVRSRQPLEPAPLEQALQALVARHEALQLRYRELEPGRWQQLHPGASAVATEELLWRRDAADAGALEALLEQARASLDLQLGPLLRAALIDCGEGRQQLYLVAHHLAVDGVSWRVLLEELELAYLQRQRGDRIQLPEPTTRGSDWAERLEAHARSEGCRSELPYWRAQLAELRPALPERPPPSDSTRERWALLELELDADQTRRLFSESPDAYRTEINDLLLTALARALCRASGETSVVVQLEGHGREPLDDESDLSRSVGWFTSVFPVRLRPRLGGAGELGASIQAVKEQLRRLPRHGLGYGALRYSGDESTRAELGALGEPSVTFNYLGQLDQSLDVSSLFAPVEPSAGAEPAERDERGALTGALGIDARVQGGQLRLELNYDLRRLEPASVRRLAELLQAELNALIEHTTSGAHGATPSDFPLIGFSQEQLDGLNLLWHDVQDLYPLTPMQEGLLLHTLLEPGSGIYLMQHDHRIEEAVDVPAFRRAWQHAAERHDVLRTSFVWNEEGMLQAVHRGSEPEIEYHDFRSLPVEQHEPALAELLQRELTQGFDLARAPLWRVRLVQTGERSFRFVFSNHHILMDAWSRAQLLQDVFAAYQALLQRAPLPREARAPFRDFIAWLEGRPGERAAAYFRQALAGFEQATPLPVDRPLGKRGGLSSVGDVAVFLSAEPSARILELSSLHDLTVNTFVQAAWALTLARHSGLDDVLFGVTVAGRPVELPEMESAVGLFINSIPLRVRLPQRRTLVVDWLRALLQQNLELRQHEHLPLVTIQAGADVGRGQPLFHSLFVFENAPVDVELLAGAERMSASAIGGRTHTNYPLTVVIYPGSRLGLHLSFDRRCFEEPTAAALLGEFERLLHELVRHFSDPLASVELVPPAERAALLGAWNATDREYPFEHGFVALFENRVRRHPDRIAASCEGEALSYAALDAQANRVAHVLRRSGAALDQPVALLGERGLPLLGAILGVFKAGAAYLPLDPRHPARRAAEILAQARPRVLLSLQASRGQVEEVLALLPPEQRPELVLLDSAELRRAPAHNPPQRADARTLAYVLFTSGSTGVPKGVMVEQAGMLNNQLSKLPWLGLSERDVIAQTASQCFDISVWQLLTALLCGARTEIVVDRVAHDPGALFSHVRRAGISVLESVPALIQACLEHDTAPLPGLRWLISTGEALPPALARRWLERHPQVSLANAYGPAECSDDVTLWRIDQAPPEHANTLPIGTPTDNNRLHVLDAELELLPIGVVGELCVAGTGVGRGYLADPRRTAELFVPHPYARTPGERLYRTGDLGRCREDGVLECVGRRDHQIKLRGYRIELGEIEARLRQHPAVGEAVVLARRAPSGQRLVGYVSVREQRDERASPAALEAELLGRLRASLPDYMVPAQLLVLDALPVTPNGKLDRRALPEPEWGDGESYVAPRSELSRSLASLWQRVLGAARVGENDNFFERGGDSLLAAQVVARMRQDLKLAVPLRVMFESQSLAELERAVLRDGRRIDSSHAWSR